jgi:hypothetical protein
MIYKASKYLQKKIPVKITNSSAQSARNQTLSGPSKDQYQLRAISVIDAVSAIIKTVKDWKKKPPETTPATFSRQAELNFTFINPEQLDLRTEVDIG